MNATTLHTSAGRETVIRITNAGKSYLLPDGRRFDALRGVSLDILRGEIFGIIGRSGAGKSTLLRLINLLERPDSGTITVAGQELTGLNARSLREARRQIGMIFQQFNLLQNATVFDNVAFPLRIQGTLNAPRLRARVADCLALVGLADRSGSYPAQLSGGQKQRVAIARALATQPDVLLDTLRDVHQQLGVTIVIVSHELPMLGSLCHRVAVLADGQVAEHVALADQSAPPKTALGRELAYYGSESYATLAGELHA